MFIYSEAVRYGARCKFSNQYVEVIKQEDYYCLKYHHLEDIGIEKKFETFDDLSNSLINIELKPTIRVPNDDSFLDLNPDDLFYFGGELYLLMSRYSRNGLSYFKYIDIYKKDVFARTLLERDNDLVPA